LDWDPESAKSHVGWYMDMTQGERTIFPFTYLGDSLFIVNTFTPDNSACHNGGHSNVYMIDACNGQSTNDILKNCEMSVFCQPIAGILYPPSVQYSGGNQMILYFSSSIPSELQTIHLNSRDFRGIRSVFDGQLFYWRTY
jgi:hypothetical protein